MLCQPIIDQLRPYDFNRPTRKEPFQGLICLFVGVRAVKEEQLLARGQSVRIARKPHHAGTDEVAPGDRIRKRKAFEQPADHPCRKAIARANGIDHFRHFRRGHGVLTSCAVGKVSALRAEFDDHLLRAQVEIKVSNALGAVAPCQHPPFGQAGEHRAGGLRREGVQAFDHFWLRRPQARTQVGGSNEMLAPHWRACLASVKTSSRVAADKAGVMPVRCK